MTYRTRALCAVALALSFIAGLTSRSAAQNTATVVIGGAHASSATDVGSPFLGGVPAGQATATPQPLGLRQAIDLGLERNLGILLQQQELESAHGARWQSLSGLLPDASARLGAARRLASLAEFGFTEFPGITSTTIGPFNVFDARVQVTQPVVDVSALYDARAGRASETAAQHNVKNARELVVLVISNLYLDALATAARVDTARAALATADALFELTSDLKRSGIAAGIDLLRAQVQQQTERQRLVAAENEWAKARLRLARAIGLPAAQEITLTDAMPYAPLQDVSLENALARAYANRPDYLAAQAFVNAAEAADHAAHASVLPSLVVNGEAGRVGTSASETDFIYGISASVKVPVFDRGRQQARMAQAGAELASRRAVAADLKGRIEFEVRSALLDVSAAKEALEAAQTARELATQQLAQSRDRFGAGVAGSLEVVQSQEALAAANDNYTTALYAHNIAKATLARAVGVAEDATKAFLGDRP
jgi:outer membrane protein TolC